jgi:hypothetical protein
MAVVINGTTGIDKVQDGSIGTADIAADAITTPKIASSVNLGRRNLIINGDMAISQRSTSVSSLTGTGYKTVDRIRVNGSGGTYNQSQQTVTVGGETGLPVQFTKFLRHECTVGNDNHILMNRTEDVSKFVGTMKLSFYAKGSGADVLAVKFHQGFGSGGSGDIYTSAQSFTVTSTWQRFEFNIVMPSITGKTVGAGNFGSVLFGQDSSNSTAAWTLDITGLQWEHGDTATPFEHRSYGDELAKCQRYYHHTYSTGSAVGTASHDNMIGSGGTASYATSSEVSGGTYTFKVEMRAVPSITFYDHLGNSARCSRLNAAVAWYANSNVGTSISTTTSSVKPLSPNGTTATGMYCHIVADAEL